jgi:hypothetical protein
MLPYLVEILGSNEAMLVTPANREFFSYEYLASALHFLKDGEPQCTTRAFLFWLQVSLNVGDSRADKSAYSPKNRILLGIYEDLAGVACALFVCLLAIFVLFLLTQFLCN